MFLRYIQSASRSQHLNHLKKRALPPVREAWLLKNPKKLKTKDDDGDGNGMANQELVEIEVAAKDGQKSNEVEEVEEEDGNDIANQKLAAIKVGTEDEREGETFGEAVGRYDDEKANEVEAEFGNGMADQELVEIKVEAEREAGNMAEADERDADDNEEEEEEEEEDEEDDEDEEEVNYGSEELLEDFRVALGYTCQKLIQGGFKKHLKSRQGARKCDGSAGNSIKILAKFLIWTYRMIRAETLRPKKVMLWLREVAIDRWYLITKYAEGFLDKKCRVSAGTIENHLSGIQQGCEWALVILPYRKLELSQKEMKQAKQDAAAFQNISKIIDKVKNSYKKDKKKSRSKRRSLTDEVKRRRLPQGGIQEIRAFLTKIGAEFLERYLHVTADEVDAKGFYLSQNLTVGHWYGYIPQGRPSGVLDMRTPQYPELMNVGTATSTHFKTYSKYGYQPVANVIEAIPFLLKVWEWRPRAIQNNGGVESSDHIFLTFGGDKPLATVATRRLTAFFKPMNLHLTFNSLRTLHETLAAEMVRLGVFTTGDQAACSSINGHTGEVARDYYRRENQLANVEQARVAMLKHGAYEQQQQQQQIYRQQQPQQQQQQQIYQQQGPQLQHAAANASTLPAGLPVRVSVDGEDGEQASVYESTTTALMLASPVHSQHLWPTSDVLTPIAWGTNHPDKDRISKKSGTPVQRATWSKVEMKYLSDWEKKNCSPFTKNKARLCLEDMQRDPFAIANFHPYHTLSSTQLGEGFKKLRKSEEATSQSQSLPLSISVPEMDYSMQASSSSSSRGTTLSFLEMDYGIHASSSSSSSSSSSHHSVLGDVFS